MYFLVVLLYLNKRFDEVFLLLGLGNHLLFDAVQFFDACSVASFFDVVQEVEVATARQSFDDELPQCVHQVLALAHQPEQQLPPIRDLQRLQEMNLTVRPVHV